MLFLTVVVIEDVLVLGWIGEPNLRCRSSVVLHVVMVIHDCLYLVWFWYDHGVFFCF